MNNEISKVYTIPLKYINEHYRFLNKVQVFFLGVCTHVKRIKPYTITTKGSM